MKTLKIADKLSLPLDAVTQKIAWLGRTGSGKTFGCKRAVEQMLHVNAQVVVLDGSGGWSGLRLGKKAFKIPVLGGLYGDIPLESTAGALVADVIVDRGTSMVLDVSQMLDAERTRFATAFAKQLFQRKKASPGAVHLVLEECQDFVPENPQRGEEQMLHEFQRLAKQGRPHGIGISFISQRPQEISKKALNQAECVFAFQMTGPHERKALQYWLSDKGFEGKLADVLPTLEVGHPYVWSPQWLKFSGVVRILPIESLDTSSTPKVGKRRAQRETLKPIDLKGLSQAMAATIERAKADDPKILKARIAELEKAMKGRLVPNAPTKAAAPMLGSDQIIVSKSGLNEVKKMVGRITQQVLVISTKVNESARGLADTEDSLHRAAGAGSKTLPARRAPTPQAAPERSTSVPATKPSQRLNGVSNGAGDPDLGNSGLRRLLVALAQSPDGLSRRALALRASLSPRASTFSTYLSRARTNGWIDGKSLFRIMPAGVQALGHFDPLPVGRDLLEHWLNEIGRESGIGRMLKVLGDSYPNGVPRSDLAQMADLSESASTFSTYLSRLRGLGLVDGKSELRMAEELS